MLIWEEIKEKQSNWKEIDNNGELDHGYSSDYKQCNAGDQRGLLRCHWWWSVEYSLHWL